jgi:hypothetical protein
MASLHVSTSPSGKFKAVTPNDSTDLPSGACRGIIFTGAGNLKITDTDGNDVTFVAPAPGMIHPIQAKRIWSTGTTVTSIFAAY